MRISSVYYLGFAAVMHLCGISMPHDVRVSVQVCITVNPKLMHQCSWKLQERLSDAILKLPLLVCRLFLGCSIFKG